MRIALFVHLLRSFWKPGHAREWALAHEWNRPGLVAPIDDERRWRPGLRLYLHDDLHRERHTVAHRVCERIYLHVTLGGPA